MDLTPYIKAAGVGATVNDYLGGNKLSDSAIAAGYAAFIDSITGRPPVVVPTSDGRVRLVMTEPQIERMQIWLDSQVVGAFRSDQPKPLVEYELGPVLKPWALKYAIPSTLALIVAGVIAGYALKSFMK